MTETGLMARADSSVNVWSGRFSITAHSMSRACRERSRAPRWILHGGDWNPDQWFELPEVVAEDLRLTPLAGCNAASPVVFS